MDRDALKRWLTGPSKTWRWNDGDRERDRGVEVTADGLRWFRWSHMPEDGGPEEVATQTVDAFLTSGAPAGFEIDPARTQEISDWIAANLEPSESA